MDCLVYGTQLDPDIEDGETLESRWISDCQVNLISLDPATNKVSYYCFLAEDFNGKKAAHTQKFTTEHVRLRVGQTSRVASPEKRPVSSSYLDAFIKVAEDAIANGYDVDLWPLGILLWQLRQCTAVAQDLNRTLYPTILATITDETVRLKMQEGTDGDCVSLMLKCIARYGVNPAAQHIANAKKYGELPKFVDPEEMANQIQTWKDYHEDVNPYVYRLVSMCRISCQ